MGMPRYLKAKFDCLYYSTNTTLEEQLGMIGHCFWEGFSSHYFVSDMLKVFKNYKDISRMHFAICTLKNVFKMSYYKNCISNSIEDKLDVISYSKYRGLRKDGSGYKAVKEGISIRRLIYDKLVYNDANHEEKDRELVKMRDYRVRVTTTVYEQRCFPPALRQIIFDRDDYKCQICGRGNTELMEYGLHLEIDHIMPYIDGGRTEFSNGQTLCSECNKGKHHAKRFFVHEKP